jgi:DNA-binding transcriptional LysR family regulator
MLNAHQLNVFLVAAETLNFTIAAQQLRMSQPSVSQHVQSLEEHFGVPLFNRMGRSIVLTEEGKVLLPLAREMVYLSNRIEEKMSSIKDEVIGNLLVGCSTSCGRYLLPHLITNYHRFFPKVRATCHITSPFIATEMLLTGKIHLLISSTFDSDKEIEFRKFFTEEITLIAPLDHPWSGLGEVCPCELCDAEFILPEEDSDIYKVVTEALKKEEISIFQFKNPIVLGSIEAIALSVQEGLGVGFVPRVVINKLVSGKVAEIRLKDLAILQDIFVGRYLPRAATTAQEAFWEFLKDSEQALLENFGLNSIPGVV